MKLIQTMLIRPKIVFCPDCGHAVGDTERVCPTCGGNMPWTRDDEEEEESNMEFAHRGPKKEGKRALHVHLSQEEYARLKEIAESELRTAASQARMIIRKALQEHTNQ